MSEIGKNLKRVRLLKKLSLKNAGELLNMSATAVSKYEKGEIEPNSQKLIEFANAYGVKVLDLLKQYKAPEMNNPSKLAKLDRRVDIYSLGASMYHMLTGENLSLTLKDEYERIPVDNLKIFGCTEYTYKIVKKCTEHNPNERYNNMMEVKSDIYNAFIAIKG